MEKNIQKYKDALLKECDTLESELATIARKNPEKSGDWEAVEKDGDTENAEEGDIAEGIETYENNIAIVGDLETRLNNIKIALKKIEDRNFGKCEVCGNEIEEDRLDVNPSSRTCKIHMNE